MSCEPEQTADDKQGLPVAGSGLPTEPNNLHPTAERKMVRFSSLSVVHFEACRSMREAPTERMDFPGGMYFGIDFRLAHAQATVCSRLAALQPVAKHFG